MPDDGAATFEKLFAQNRLAATVGDVPLAGRDDFERLVTLFKELHRVRDFFRFTDEVARFAKHLHHALFSGVAGGTRQARVVFNASGLGDPCGRFRKDAAVPADDRTGRQLQLSPPDHVGEIAEGADHCDARAFFGVSESVRNNGNLHTECGGGDGGAEKWLVSLIIWVGNESNAGGEKFRPRGLDEHLFGR